MQTKEVLVLWREGEVKCEFHAGLAGQSRLVVFSADQIISAESTPSGPPAYQRAEVLRQRALRGDLP